MEKTVIDRKYKFIAVNPCKGTWFDETEGIVFKAGDMAVPIMLEAYRMECIRLGALPEHIKSLVVSQFQFPLDSL